MDPPAMMNEGSYNFAEIWQFPVHGSGSMSESGGRLGLRGAHFGENFSQFGINREVSDDDPVSLEQKMAHGNGARKRRDVEDESARLVSTSNCNGNGNGVNDSDGKRIKKSGSRDDNHSSKAEEEPSLGKLAEQNSQPPEPPKQDYIHVRARRGQATDNHSLAERARREKISERMKNLQDLVPGCNKVIGKALVLDEIINYIQSLQQQVEFLSMKLEAVNTRMNPGIEVFPPKDEMVGRFGFLFNKANYIWAVISLVNKHLILPTCQLFLKLQGNTTMVHHLTGCICRSEAVLKE